MAYEVYGPYSTIAEARKNIDILGLEGVKNEHIFVFSSKDVLNELKNQTDAHIEGDNTANSTENHSLIDKLKNFFSTNDSNSEENIQEKLRSLGISDKQAEKYMSDITSGNILVVADNEKRMGHDAADDTTVMEEPMIGHE